MIPGGLRDLGMVAVKVQHLHQCHQQGLGTALEQVYHCEGGLLASSSTTSQ